MASTKLWHFQMSKKADKDFSRLDKPVQQRIVSFFEDRVLPAENPRSLGKALKGHLAGLWSYRIGDYRVIADIKDNELIILVVQLDHRRQVYDC